MLERLKDPTTQINLLRLYNFAVALFVLKGLCDTPNASVSEYSFDVYVHLLQASVSLASTEDEKKLATVANVTRLAFIAGHTLVVKDSTIPLAVNAVDIGNHLLNLYKTGVTLFPAQKTAKVESASNEPKLAPAADTLPKKRSYFSKSSLAETLYKWFQGENTNSSDQRTTTIRTVLDKKPSIGSYRGVG